MRGRVRPSLPVGVYLTCLEVRGPFGNRGAKREMAPGHRFEGGTDYLDSVTLGSSPAIISAEICHLRNGRQYRK